MERLVLHSHDGKRLEPPQTVCCVSLHETDKVRVVSFPVHLLHAFRVALQISWKKGVQAEGVYGCSYQFKLGGNPWSGAKHEALDSRRLAIGIMRFMLSHGWGLELATDFSKNKQNKDVWFFRKQSLETHVVMCGISFNKTNSIRIIDGLPDVTEVVLSTIKNHWYRGLQEQGIYREVPEFKLNGNPWAAADGKDALDRRAFVMKLMDALRRSGWVVYASVDITCGSRSRGDDKDSWILKKSKLKV